MVLCRECERLLLRTPERCPSCSAQRPGARLRGRQRRTVWLLAPAVSAPALAGADAAARWLLGGG